MTAPAVDVAVQIAAEALRKDWPRSADTFAMSVVSALARAGWLHDPDEVERLRATILASASDLQPVIAQLDATGSVTSEARPLIRRAFDRLFAALDAAPAAGTTSGNEAAAS